MGQWVDSCEISKNQINSIFLEDLKCVEIAPPMSGCIGVVGWMGESMGGVTSN